MDRIHYHAGGGHRIQGLFPGSLTRTRSGGVRFQTLDQALAHKKPGCPVNPASGQVRALAPAVGASAVCLSMPGQTSPMNPRLALGALILKQEIVASGREGCILAAS